MNESLSSFSRHGFELDRQFWPSVEHYNQGMKFEIPADREKVRLADHPAKAKRLLVTGDTKPVENSQYDYFWGCGRDRRGYNTYGKVLMDVRSKLREESDS